MGHVITCNDSDVKVNLDWYPEQNTCWVNVIQVAGVVAKGTLCYQAAVALLPIALIDKKNRFRVLLVHEQMARFHLRGLWWLAWISAIAGPAFRDGGAFWYSIYLTVHLLSKLLETDCCPVCLLHKFQSEQAYLKGRLSILHAWGTPGTLWSMILAETSDMRRCLIRHYFDNPFILLVQSESGISVTLSGFLLR
jgi:hypothetical protein